MFGQSQIGLWFYPGHPGEYQRLYGPIEWGKFGEPVLISQANETYAPFPQAYYSY